MFKKRTVQKCYRRYPYPHSMLSGAQDSSCVRGRMLGTRNLPLRAGSTAGSQASPGGLSSG